eukprot:15264206-Alexandrium_andersonii.AAC.1
MGGSKWVPALPGVSCASPGGCRPRTPRCSPWGCQPPGQAASGAFRVVQGGGNPPLVSSRGSGGRQPPRDGAGNSRKRWYQFVATHLDLAEYG